GSATPKNTRPIPMPAANSIASQVARLNSGLESSGPSRIRPQRDSAKTIANTRQPATVTTNSQPKRSVIAASKLANDARVRVGHSDASSTNANTSVDELQNTPPAWGLAGESTDLSPACA